MTILTKKFSEFDTGGDLDPSDITVGLEGGVNSKFTNPSPNLARGTTLQRPTPSSTIEYRLRFNTTEESWEYYSPVAAAWITLSDSGDVVAIIGTEHQVLANDTVGVPAIGAVTLTTPQDIDTTSSPTFNNLQLNGASILDVNGNISLNFSSVANAVNYIQITNDAAGGPPTGAPTIKALGTDPSIDVVLQPKGPAGGIAFVTECTDIGGSFNIYSGTSGQHQTTFDFANTAALRGVTFQDASGTVAFLSDIPGAFTWNNVTGTSAAMSVANGYKANNASLVTLTLPTSSVFGNVIQIAGFGAGGWSIAQAAGQSVIIGAVSSTVGVAGSVSSSNQFDSVVLVCMEDNITWQCLSAPQGNLTII